MADISRAMDKQMQFLIYNTPEEQVSVDVIVKDETIWVTQRTMAELFGCSSDNISLHLKNIYASNELQENSTAEEFSVVRKEGSRNIKRKVTFYNLDAIISVGYRVNSSKATKFRIWATQVLKEYIQKGFAMDDERLKQGKTVFGKDYFRELLERVRSIRASERRIWQQITDIFAECSIDYDKNSEETRSFYAMVQNKFHYAIVGQTAAEIIYSKADRTKEHMGLTTWKNAPEGRVLKSDVAVAKNYLNEKEIRQLERAVTGYFDYIEDLIERENTFDMKEFAASVNEFLAFRRYDILPDKGKVSRQQALEKAYAEYDAFNKTQKITSDFDLLLKATEKICK
nr:virulence RhuM family protein [uncultured Phascolarctobacterium sp.]